jgi:dihydrofolate reductase
MIVMIAAVAENNALGKDNELVWHLPNDFKRFKELTSGHYIIMGRKTFESLGNKALNGRLNIIITKQKDYKAVGIVVANSLEDAVFIAHEHQYKEILIAGGGEIYKQALPKANKIYVTRVETNIDGDTFFEMNEEDWNLSFADEKQADEKHLYNYTFETWTRK